MSRTNLSRTPGLMRLFSTAIPCAAMLAGIVCAQQDVAIQWHNVQRVNRCNASLQAVVTPLMSRNSPLHDKVWQTLKDLHAQHVRYVPWLPYPKLAVAELEPPENGKTSWDFSLIDPFTIDFLEATKGHSVMLNFSTIPQWMFKTPQPVSYPADPNHAVWDYTQGTELRDPSMKELGDYYARLVSWYSKGGFVDEFDKRHDSGHRYKWDYWEVLNEPDLEHKMTPQQYTACYDTIVTAIRKVQPAMKFVGLSLAAPKDLPQYFEHFLDPKNHQPGIPLDMISYHFYASISAEAAQQESWEETVFDQTRKFLDTVKRIEAVRQRLAPQTATAINEIGVIHPQDGGQSQPDYVFKPFPARYWNLCAAQFALLYGELANLGIEMIGQSALMQVPEFFPSVSMMDWQTGRPNARYWALKLLCQHFGPGDKLPPTTTAVAGVYSQAFLTKSGQRKILLVNTHNQPAAISIAGSAGGTQETVDQTTGFDPPAARQLDSDKLNLAGLAVQVITLP
ncbi:MAG: glycosyl hydrolase family 39 [Verrucomicrobiota bacterium]